MNERLKQLAIESKLIAPEYNGFDHTRLSISQQRFAELIVRECVEACSRANEIRHFVPPTQQQVVLSCMDEIERTFGIKK